MENPIDPPPPAHKAEMGQTVISTGWMCPRCGAVMAPHVDFCQHCSAQQFPVTTGQYIPWYPITPQIFCQCGMTQTPRKA